MRTLVTVAAVLSWSVAVPAGAAGPVVDFTLPALHATPSVFGSLPFPNDLYFDQGQPGAGDGTLLDSGATIGLAPNVIGTNTASVEDALDLLDGFGTTTAIYFFASAPWDALPATQFLVPSLADPIFCADAATATPVPILVKANVDTRVPNILAVLPAPGRPLAPKTTYTCVVRTTLTAGGQPVGPSADFASVRDGTSANSDADAIYDPVVATLGAHGVAASVIAGMTVFTTESTTADLVKIRDLVLPGLPAPTADFTSQPNLVFDSPAKLQSLLGRPAVGVATIATGYFGAPRFQTHDPNGDGPLGDLPNPPSFVTCSVPCETTDERFQRDGSGTPIVIDTPQIPFTVVVPSGTPPAGGWPVVIQQHGLGGQRDTVVAFGEADAAKGFASIGIDAAAHGYRFFACSPASACSQDTHNNFGGTAVPDGFADGTFAGFDLGFLTVNLGFFQAFHNFVGIRDNFRQTYADLLSLVRLLHGHSIDSALGAPLDDANVFYMGHSLGGIMGSGFVPIAPDVKAALLNATGGGLTSQLFLNSSIGAGAMALVDGILGLDPTNVADQFALQPNLTQAILDPADGLNSAALLLAPDAGAPRNVVQVEDFGDQVVPNQANEALAVAAGLPIFDPYVQDLHQSPFTLPIANPGTPKTVHGNAAGGFATAVLLQNGPATHAASVTTSAGTITFVPEFAHIDEFVANGNAFPSLERGIRIQNAGILDAVLDWFHDVAVNGTPGTFAFGGDPNFNPVENTETPAGASTHTFFARTVDAGGGLPTAEPTPDVVLQFASNTVATRVTAARTILGTTPLASDADVPPGPGFTVGTPGVLPFFVTVQRLVPALFSADLTIAYTPAELNAAGILPGSPAEAQLLVGRFVTGACAMGGAACSENGACGVNGPCLGAHYQPFLGTAIDATAHTAHASGLTTFSTFALLAPSVFAVAEPGAGSTTTDCHAEWQVVNPNAPAPTKTSRAMATQTCHEGDPNCDADGPGNGTCTFRVAICFDVVDASLPKCSPVPMAGYDVTRRKSTSAKPFETTNGQALVDALLALGGTASGTPSRHVTFTAPITTRTCTPFASLRVAAGKTAIVNGKARGAVARDSDVDKLKLGCLP